MTAKPLRPRVYDPNTGEYERLTVQRANDVGWLVVSLGTREIGAVRPDREASHGKAGWSASSTVTPNERSGLKRVDGFRGQAEALVYLVRVLRGAFFENDED